MKNSHAPLLLLASMLANGCTAQKPANFSEVVKETVANANLVEMASESPLHIRVSVNAERNVFLGKEKVGTVGDLGPLKERLKEAVERNRRGASNANDAAHTVFLCAPETFKYGDVAPVIDAIKEAGGNPIGLRGCEPPR